LIREGENFDKMYESITERKFGDVRIKIMSQSGTLVSHPPPSTKRTKRFKASIAPVELLAVGAEEAATICGIGLTLWKEMDVTGRIPSPIKFGARCVWYLDELRRWMDTGCPDRERWEILKKSKL